MLVVEDHFLESGAHFSPQVEFTKSELAIKSPKKPLLLGILLVLNITITDLDKVGTYFMYYIHRGR